MSFYSATVLGLKPVIYWRLSDAVGSGTVADSSGNGNGGTVNGTVTFGQAGALAKDADNAALFDGTTGYINTTGTVNVSGSFSVEFWWQMSAAGATAALINSRQPSDNSMDIDGGANLHADIGTGSAWLTTGANLVGSLTATRLAWYHTVYVVTPTGYTIYLNGGNRGSGAYSGTPLLSDSTHQMRIGGNGGASFFAGVMDEVAVYPVALTGDQVLRNYDIGRGGPPPSSVLSPAFVPVPKAITPGAIPGVRMAVVVTPGNVPNFAPDGVWLIQEVTGLPPATCAPGVRMVKPIPLGGVAAAPSGVIPVTYIRPGMTAAAAPAGSTPIIRVDMAGRPV